MSDVIKVFRRQAAQMFKTLNLFKDFNRSFLIISGIGFSCAREYFVEIQILNVEKKTPKIYYNKYIITNI